MSKYSSRCTKCIHKRVCAYKDYFSEKEREKIDRCKNFQKEEFNKVLTVPKGVNIDVSFLDRLCHWVSYTADNHFAVKQGGREVAFIDLYRKSNKARITYRPSTMKDDIKYEVIFR